MCRRCLLGRKFGSLRSSIDLELGSSIESLEKDGRRKMERFQVNTWERGYLMDCLGRDITMIEVDSKVGPVDGGIEVCVIEDDGR